jgi:hypothetical protein
VGRQPEVVVLPKQGVAPKERLLSTYHGQSRSLGGQAQVATTERATFTRQWQTTKMVGVAKTKAQACIEVRNPRGMSAPLCTPFIGH